MFKNKILKTSLEPSRPSILTSLRVLHSDSDRLQEDSDVSVDRYGLSPDSHSADAADFSPKSPLSLADSVCGRSPVYEDFWRPPSPSASPGKHRHHSFSSASSDLCLGIADECCCCSVRAPFYHNAVTFHVIIL